jgi:uncharacterized membrane protein
MHFFILALLAIWVLGIFIELIMSIFPSLTFIHPFLKLAYSNVCHQQPEKLINFEYGKTLTCARCTGIYLGGLSAAIALIFIKVNRKIGNKLFPAAIGLIVIDVLMYSTGAYAYSKIIALLSGLFLGSIVIYYFYIGINEFFIEKKLNTEKN